MPRRAALSVGNHLRAGSKIGAASFGKTFTRHVARQPQHRRSRSALAVRPYARQAQAAPPPIYREQLSDPAHIGAKNNSSVPVQVCCLCRPMMAAGRWRLSARFMQGGPSSFRRSAEASSGALAGDMTTLRAPQDRGDALSLHNYMTLPIEQYDEVRVCLAAPELPWLVPHGYSSLADARRNAGCCTSLRWPVTWPTAGSGDDQVPGRQPVFTGGASHIALQRVGGAHSGGRSQPGADGSAASGHHSGGLRACLSAAHTLKRWATPCTRFTGPHSTMGSKNSNHWSVAACSSTSILCVRMASEESTRV